MLLAYCSYFAIVDIQLYKMIHGYMELMGMDMGIIFVQGYSLCHVLVDYDLCYGRCVRF
jgi:hypothetical protein